MHQIITPPIKKRLFHLSAFAHKAPNSGSTGQDLPGRYKTHSAVMSNKPVIAKFHSLYSLRVIKNGTFVAREATTAPIPKLTNRIGKAQHSNVVVEANKISTPHFFGFLILFIATPSFFVLVWTDRVYRRKSNKYSNHLILVLAIPHNSYSHRNIGRHLLAFLLF